MIEDIVHLGSTVASEICTPRVDIIQVEDDETVHAALDRMRGTGFTRLPVRNSEDNQIIGMVFFKDLVNEAFEGNIDAPVTKFMRKAKYVPESKNVIKLLEEMQMEHLQSAIVIDEYGGTEGLITVEDIVEEIVGEIADETDNVESMIEQINDHTWRVSGKFPVEMAIEKGWPVKESEDYETIAGWLLDETDTVPESGEQFEIDGYTFRIERMRRNRIQTIQVTANA